MVTGAVGLAALVFVLLAVESGPPPHRQVAATPLANPTTAAGQRGGLLPAVSLAAQPAGIPATALHSARDLRPGLVALVPLSCRCTDVLSALASEADEVRVPLHVVAPAEGDAEVSALPGQLPAVKVWFDAAGELARTYAAAGVTVLVVDPDGVVSFVQRQTTVSLAHTLPLQSMLVLPPSIRTR
jgi:hypothetical protein